ncbi:MAG: hypothetical protein ACK4VY_07620 [Brevundimonas sp.]
METPPPKPSSLPSGLIQGGMGGPEDELLQDGQEEVFARAELETGRVEHQAGGEAEPQRKVD